MEKYFYFTIGVVFMYISLSAGFAFIELHGPFAGITFTENDITTDSAILWKAYWLDIKNGIIFVISYFSFGKASKLSRLTPSQAEPA